MNVCRVCSKATSETRKQIHELRAAGTSFRNIARIVGFSPWSVFRHLRNRHDEPRPVIFSAMDESSGLPPRRGWFQPK